MNDLCSIRVNSHRRQNRIEEEEDDAVEEEDTDEEEDLEVDEWEYKNKKYYVTDTIDGCIFEYLDGGDIGEEIGYLKKSKVFFSKPFAEKCLNIRNG